MEITEPDELVCEITGSENVSCFEGSDGSATVEASGGTGSYSYLWSDGQETATATGLSAGTYTVTITDENGCETECEVEITEPTELTCTVEENYPASCDALVGGSATVYPVGGTPFEGEGVEPYQYSWKDAWNVEVGTTTTVDDLAPGDYFVTVTDANGCTTTCEVTITRTPEYFVCETAFALLGDPEVGCFLQDGFDRWGWTNLISPTEFEGEEYVMPLWSGAAQCETDKGTHVGNAIVTYFGGTVTVEYDMFEGFVLKEAHVYVGYDPYPVQKGKNGGPTVAPGQYNYNSGPLDNVDGLSDIVFDGLDGSDVYIIVHGVACEAVCIWDEPEALAVGFYQNFASKGKKSGLIELSDVNVNSLKAYPNPFSQEVTFEFVSRKDAHAVLEITNVLGQKVTTLMNRRVQEGVVNTVRYNPDNVQSGILIYRLIIDKDIQTGRLLYKK